MTCFSPFLKYPFAALAQTPAAYILMYCNAFSTTFTAVRCFQLRKNVLRLDTTSYQSSDRTVQHLFLWVQNEHEWQFCEEFAPHPGGTNDNHAHACEQAYNPDTFFLNWKQSKAGKAVEDALQYIKKYVAGVWTKTAEEYFKNVEEQVIRRQRKVWSNL